MPRTCRVLVVEDNEGIQELLGDVFSHEGYLFALARNGEEMRAALDRGGVDVVIIDIVLPGPENGLALAQLVVERGVAVILVTGSHDHFAELENSGHVFMMKPFHVASLLQLVERTLREARADCRIKGRELGNLHPVS